jgi:hypothetical protein
MMAESGCRSLFIGFETVNSANLRSCHKTQNRIRQYDALISGIHVRDMMVNASVVFGFDHDDTTVFPTTLQWLEDNKVETMTGHILTPYPGTRLYRQLLAEGRLIDTDLRHYNTAHAVFRPNRLTPEELEHGYLWIYRQFYSWRSILHRWPVSPKQRLAYLQFSLLYRKYGKITSLLGKLAGMRVLARMARAVAYPSRKNQECSERTMGDMIPVGAGQGYR